MVGGGVREPNPAFWERAAFDGPGFPRWPRHEGYSAMIMKAPFRYRTLGLLAATLFVVCACSRIVIIPDQALESALRAELRKPLALFLTARDLRRVTELDARSLNIQRLDGLEHCTSLTKLYLSGNVVPDVAPLASATNLVVLDLRGNRITDIEAIAGLLFLEYLDLSGPENVIRDWSGLQANVLSGGLGRNDTVVLSRVYTLDSEGNPLPAFSEAHRALIDAGVVVEYVE